MTGERAVALAEALGVATDCDLWTAATRERWRDANPTPRRQLSWV